jgi:hypothetical protein
MIQDVYGHLEPGFRAEQMAKLDVGCEARRIDLNEADQ